ncbi:MAG: RnfABCDGE type electron transport complex subunit D [bacterium]
MTAPRGPRPVDVRSLLACARRADPRWFQIAVLASLVTYGLTVLRFDLPPAQVAITVGAALASQVVLSSAVRVPRLELKSALISSLSLCLLLRTSAPALAGVASIVAIASKFAIRVGDKHVFNPTNLALAVMLAASDRVWISSGQWGNTAIFAAALALAGLLVVQRSARSDVTVAFLATYVALVFGRSAWLGEPMAIPLHRLESGALVLFAFFMISDPRTTPDARLGRIGFAALVAAGAWYVQFRLFRTNGLVWSLVACSTLTPLVDRLLRGPRYQWDRPVTRVSAPALAAA